jgi:lambda repressor-like predicted transcriptional regulator
MPMTPEQIKQELADRKVSYSKLARRARPKPLSTSTIYKNVHMIPGAKSSKARRIIAQAIGKTEEEVYGVAA